MCGWQQTIVEKARPALIEYRINAGSVVEVRRLSDLSMKHNEMTFPEGACPHAKFIAWTRGEELIQDALPQLSAGQREFLLSGASPAEWAKFLKDTGEDE